MKYLLSSLILYFILLSIASYEPNKSSEVSRSPGILEQSIHYAQGQNAPREVRFATLD